MNYNYDAIIIGGGVNGCSIAYQLAKRGCKTAILERNIIGAEASSAAAGMLGAQVEFEKNDAFFQFACQSREMFPELINELESLTGMRAGYTENGMLKIACTNEESIHLQKMKHMHSGAGQDVDWWDLHEILLREPAISREAKAALHIPKDGQVKANELTIAFARAALNMGADIYEFTEVYSLEETDGKVEGAKTEGSTFYAEEIIVASGVWSKRLADHLSMVPVKGEILSVRPEKPLISRTIHAADFYMVPKMGGSLYIGATEKPGTFNKKVTVKGIHDLLQKAQVLIPALQDAVFEGSWSGVRPQTADGKPYIGKAEKKGLWIAAGHFRNGILLSAITGKWLADLIEGNSKNPEWEAAFSPQRLQMKEEDTVEVSH